MNHEPNFRKMMREAGISDSDLPGWLQEAIRCHLEAWMALEADPQGRRDEFEPILIGSDAVISAHVQRVADERGPSPATDKMKMLKLKAKAVAMLLKQA